VKERFLKAVGREVRGMHQAAYLLAAFSLGSQLLALVRDRLLAAAFGAGHTLDLYYAAFRVPDFLFATVASLFSLYALLPVLSRLEKEKPGLMISFLRSTLIAFFAGMMIIGMAAFILAPLLAVLIAPGLAADAASRADLILLMRILLLQPILLGASNTIAALTQLRHRFILYSVSPLLYNLGIIFGAVYLYPRFGVAGLGWGVVLGALAHLLLQLPFFLAEKPTEKLSLSRTLKSLREVLVLSVPRTFALAATQISLVAIVAMASLLVPGSIAVFTFAYNLQAVPLTIIGVSYAIAAFPTLARLHADGDHKAFAGYVETALRHILFWSIPATVFIVVLRAQLVRVILGAGAFDWDATRLTAAALAIFVVSLAAQALTMLIARVYYATGNTRKPLYYGFVDIFVSITSALALVVFFNESMMFREFVGALLRVDDVPGTGVLMLALGYALGSTAEFLVSYYFFVKDFNLPHRVLMRLSFQSFAAAVIGGAVAYVMLLFTGFSPLTHTLFGLLFQGAFAGILGLCATAGVLALLKNSELAEAAAAFKRYFKFKYFSPVVVEPSDIGS
jgi:putative peptidoglycan lipid II flippase